MVLVIACVASGACAMAAAVALLLSRRKLRTLNARYSSIVDADKEARRIVESARLEADARMRQALEVTTAQVSKANEDSERLIASAKAQLADAQAQATRLVEEAQRTLSQQREQTAALVQERNTLNIEYAQARQTYDRLAAEVHNLEENLEDISFGLYKPHYTYDTPEGFKEELDAVRSRQKDMIRAGTAASFAVTWTVGGSEREGAKMQKQYTKLLLRAFNGECDAAVAKVSWNNAKKMEERIEKAFEAINQLGEVMTVAISREYRKLKIAELRLEHEFEEKKRAVADEQRRIREQMREEERAQREAERAQNEAEAEEARYQRALDKARVEFAKSKGDEHRRLNEKLVELQERLAEAQAKSQRAKSLAQLTKAGYVYILSNIGSFGDGVFKIGMTRRLDPMDRVKELGDASVPFAFDVHAMVYSENAPELENALHQHFADRSVNLVNMRKEFFRVDLDEIEKFAVQRGFKISFTKLAEAREYRETLEILRSRSSRTSAIQRGAAKQTFPSTLSAGN